MIYIAKVRKEKISEILVKMLEKETTEENTNYLIRKKKPFKMKYKNFHLTFSSRL